MGRLTIKGKLFGGIVTYRKEPTVSNYNVFNKLGRLEDAQEILRTKRVDIAHLQDSKDCAEYNEVVKKLASLWRVLPLTEEEYQICVSVLKQ